MAIPRIIHQLWKDDAVPERYRLFRETWARLHPGWQTRLWTDRDIEALVASDYPHLAETYRRYVPDISRADLGRYLVLHRFGGVYADLDCECLKPIGVLIEGAEFAIGLEPKAHFAIEPRVAAAGFAQLLCPSFIASAPSHPFWDAVLERIVEVRDAEDVLEATGPLMLTRLYHSDPRAGSIRLLPEEQVYPVAKTDCWNGRVHDLEFWERATRDAYVLHYWDGGWFRGEVWSGGLPADVPAGVNDPGAPRAGFDHAGAKPTISCLMIATGALAPARLAIEAYLAQTYAARELLIVAREPDQRLLAHLRALDRDDLRLVRAQAGASLADQRNLGRALAQGAVLCRWDEGDLHDPRRLEVQYEVLKQTDAYACMMRRWVAWRPAEARLGVVDARPLAASLMALKSTMPAYPPGTGDQQDPIAEAFLAQVRVALFDLARLYVHVDAGDGADHVLATPFEGERYDAVLTELAKRLPIEARLPPPGIEVVALEPEVRLFGHFSSSSGIGSSSRGTATALAAAGVAFDVVHIPRFDDHPAPVPASPRRVAPGGAWPVNLVHMNPGDLAVTVGDNPAAFGLAKGRRAFTIGIWAWETLTGIPFSWRAYFPTYDEIWTPSAHAAAAIAKSSPVPVVVMPHMIAPPAPGLDRKALGLPATTFIFLFVFNAQSNVERKNPAGLIAAYVRAFPAASAAVMLLIKTRALSVADLATLTALSGGRADIRIVAEPWRAERLFSVMAACDAYVSLHRAEGFGRTMAEAMAFAKPVIATAYSGNMDFMSPETAYLVPYRLATLDAANGDYAAGSVWADPDLEAAAGLMAHVAAHRDEAAAVGARAALWVKTHLSAEATGQRIRARLDHLRVAKLDVDAASKRRANPDPKVLILTPVKDACAHLPRYLELLRRLDYDPARLSLAFLEGDSRDHSYEALAGVLPALDGQLTSVQLHRFDYGLRIDGARWAPNVQLRRREIIARARNRLLAAALGDQDHVLWLDADLTDYPADLLRRLLAADKEIVVPHCLGQDGTTFDLNSFRFSPESGGRDDPRHLVDGLFQPPRGAGRVYLDAFPLQDMVPLDAVGGTALLINADLHREGLSFPPFRYRGYIETEGLAMMARDMGVTSWGLPQLTVVHS